MKCTAEMRLNININMKVRLEKMIIVVAKSTTNQGKFVYNHNQLR